MPRGGNKKKKGRNRNSTKGRDVRQSKNTGRPATTYLSQGSTMHPTFEGVSPNFETFQQRGTVLPHNYRTEYSRYKAATKRVFEYLQENARENSARGQDKQMTMHVDSLVAAADWMAEARIPVDPDRLKDLKFAIRMRSKVARSFYGGGDSGHKYLLDTLVYCWKVLDSLPRAEKKDITRKKEEELDNDNGEGWSRNPFGALQETGELEEEDDSIMDEEIFSSQDVPRPTLDAEPTLLQDLLDSDDRIDASLFLLTLNDFMRCVAEQHGHVPKIAEIIMEGGGCGSAIVPALLGPAISTNMAIQQVQRLEIEFELHNPHINTPYRLLSTILLPVLVQDVVQITREHGQKVCSARDANLFLGDCLECSFREETDPENKKSEIVSDFCSRFEIDSKGSEDIDEMFLSLRSNTIFEVPFKYEFELTEAMGSTSHVWLQPSEEYKYIGGDRAIHHTIRLLQWFGSLVKKTPKGQLVKPNEALFGSSSWQPGRSNKIHNDLDELLMADILPYWFCLCGDSILKSDAALPRQSELAPLWSCIRRFVHSPEKPVRWSTVFAVHAILTAVLETDKISAELALVCQKTFDSYFSQLDIACDHKKGVDGSFDSSLFQPGLSALRYVKNLGHPFFGPRALWNPLCAGTSLLYLNYQANIEYGTPLIDDRSQLKIVLHLYHALILNDILQRGDIPVLDNLYHGFEKSKTLWGGSLPSKGKLVEQFWLSMRGRFIVCEKIMAKVSRLDDTILSNQEHVEMIEMLCNNETQVVSGLMNPAEFSKSFRRICNRDYHDVRQQGSGNDVYEFAVQLNDTIDAFVSEHPFFAVNLPACGVYLDEFVCGMSHFFQWDLLFKGALRDQNTQLEHPERIAEVYMFAHFVLGTLDQATDPSELGRIRDFVTFFMCPFFEKLRVGEKPCVWFAGLKK